MCAHTDTAMGMPCQCPTQRRIRFAKRQYVLIFTNWFICVRSHGHGIGAVVPVSDTARTRLVKKAESLKRTYLRVTPTPISSCFFFFSLPVKQSPICFFFLVVFVFFFFFVGGFFVCRCVLRMVISPFCPSVLSVRPLLVILKTVLKLPYQTGLFFFFLIVYTAFSSNFYYSFFIYILKLNR